MVYLSLVIPAYNEEHRLPQTLLKIKDFLNKQKYTFEVLVVDDGSTDRTVEKIKEIAHDFPQLRLITNTENKGKGGVVKQGMLEAGGKYRLFMDADYSTPISEVEKLLRWVPRYQVVIGSRYLEPGSIKIRQPLKRRILSRASNLVIRLLAVPGIKDTQCGFKLFSAEATAGIFPLQTMDGWSFDFELLHIARKQGYEIKEVAVDWYDSDRSTLRASRAALKSLRDLFAISLRS
jgi:dolichyl-phosphate beta-glucosyltransferase